MKKINKNQINLFDFFVDFKGFNSKYKYQNYLNKMFFSLSPKRTDIAAIKTTKPNNLLLSYSMWKEQKGMYKFDTFVESLWKDGYKPTIILDSGAFTFSSKDIDISLDDYREGIEDTYERELSIEELAFDYIQGLFTGGVDMNVMDQDEMLNYIVFIYQNYKYIDFVVSLDHFTDSNISMDNYKFLKGIGIKSIPTFHIGEDIKVLEEYINLGADYIGLGGIVPFKLNGGKGVNSKISTWINNILRNYPGLKFHLFGCQDPKILDNCLPSLYSSDGAGWIISAGNKYDREFGIDDKIRLAVMNIKYKECLG